MMKKFLSTLILAAMSVCVHAQYVPMDYSTCGYRGSDVAIPDVGNVVAVKSSDGDCTAKLQRAIDEVSARKADKNGFRGAVLLGEGVYSIADALRISVSGIVIRGCDKHKTIIRKTGADRGALLYIEGRERYDYRDTLDIVGNVKAGEVRFTVNGADKIHRGDVISIFRPSTKEWIARLSCRIFGGGIDYTGWKPTDIDLLWERRVVAVDGDMITVDAPVTTAISTEYGGGKVFLGCNRGKISNCGVENLTLESEHGLMSKDEDHCWDGIYMNEVNDCWVRRVVFEYFAGSAVLLQRHVSRVTVEDCIADHPVSEVGGWRRCVFLTRGQQTLFQRCISRQGIHDFAAGYVAPGPNAFVQCEAEGALGFSGSIGSWSPGLLFDVVNIDGSDLKFANLEQQQFGTGWNTANSMMWQCTASQLDCYSPTSEDKNSANGCWGTFQGNGEWSESNNHVKPRSLFYAQLSKRNGTKALEGYVLPRNTDASSSPSVEVAQKMAKESLTIPRLTMEMWLDSVPYTASVSEKGLRIIDDVKPEASIAKTANHHAYAVENGKIVCDGQLLVGNRMEIPWWSGRTKDNYLSTARRAITRFVPGYEDNGATDRIDSVVTYMKNNGILLLDHNYGLWYDLRRTDHERVRRSNGDVWAPFYEQPFARSGEGIAWDGLSKYDLTKPNRWYWKRLKDFADKAGENKKLLFHENYFQHNILEAGAHWVDCPWRPVNNINGTTFPEPVPFTGDKRIFMAEYFYNEQDSVLRKLHRNYIRQCLDNFKDDGNVVQLISAEYTGPLHFTRFWLETIAEWEKETGRHPLIALSCTKDVQDSLLADKRLSKFIDVIDIRYWHYNAQGLWAPEGGRNLAPRQHIRNMKVGSTSYAEAYKAVREYREKYPDKAVTFFAQQYPSYGWAILMAGGSCPNIPVSDAQLLKDVSLMDVMASENTGFEVIGKTNVGYIIYSHHEQHVTQKVESGTYRIWHINPENGEMDVIAKIINAKGMIDFQSKNGNNAYWVQKF